MKFCLLICFHIALIWASSLEKHEQFRNKRNIGGRIIGGTPAYAGQFTFAAAIHVHTADGTFFCGGALISNEWILTAAHSYLKRFVDFSATLFTIQLGSNQLEGEDSNRVTLATSEYVVYPDFNPETLEHDVGLIKLRMPLEFTNYIRATQHLALVPIQDDTTVQGLGWGQVDDLTPELSNDLNVVYLKSISNAECRITYGNQITDNMVCVSGNYNEGACLGDTGSALIQVVSRGRQIHVGISSFISGNGCQSTDPSGYTRTFAYIDWIRNTSGVWDQ
ncbi:Trypsin domain containing protein [Asbolus verrucosus]|uniref:Trypsin domain containing protein n=1 Tax=Asbolus verrucosus TaxID=1661398 RepID=A0A482VX99_ASBVE|nr:Trypsin domain containing protein [Asbolus verrucosus]